MKYRVLFFGQLEMWEIDAENEEDAARKIAPLGQGPIAVAPEMALTHVCRGQICAGVIPEEKAEKGGLAESTFFWVKQGMKEEMGSVNGTSSRAGGAILTGLDVDYDAE